MKISSHSAYTDGHESTIEHNVPDMDIPKQEAFLDADAWLEAVWDVLHRYTGDGHGQNSSLGWFYSIDILDAADPALVGEHWENCGN